jgi:hypothetical protein
MNILTKRALRVPFALALPAASCLLLVSGQPRGQQRRHHEAAAVVAAAATNAQQPEFQLDCTLPSLTPDPVAIDRVCAAGGDSAPDSDSARQNEIKGRFCLPDAPATPTDVTFATFDALQLAARQRHIPFGRTTLPDGKSAENLPTDRSVLTDMMTDAQGQHLGEGSLVTLEGFVFKAHHSNTFVSSGSLNKGGESVNCHAKTLAGNDIHIALSRTKAGTRDTTQQSSECETVTAEISPHHRSALFNRFDTNPKDFLNGSAQKRGQDKLRGRPLPLQGARVRVTGQLFFDASHSPCVNGKGSPARRSIWEVHPVYAIDVFDTTQRKFVSFAQWARSH